MKQRHCFKLLFSIFIMGISSRCFAQQTKTEFAKAAAERLCLSHLAAKVNAFVSLQEKWLTNEKSGFNIGVQFNSYGLAQKESMNSLQSSIIEISNVDGDLGALSLKLRNFEQWQRDAGTKLAIMESRDSAFLLSLNALQKATETLEDSLIWTKIDCAQFQVEQDAIEKFRKVLSTSVWEQLSNYRNVVAQTRLKRTQLLEAASKGIRAKIVEKIAALTKQSLEDAEASIDAIFRADAFLRDSANWFRIEHTLKGTAQGNLDTYLRWTATRIQLEVGLKRIDDDEQHFRHFKLDAAQIEIGTQQFDLYRKLLQTALADLNSRGAEGQVKRQKSRVEFFRKSAATQRTNCAKSIENYDSKSKVVDLSSSATSVEDAFVVFVKACQEAVQ